ncbi:MAG: substrate-binding domain-containing protein [Bacteroidetes bacterium]|nr:substrate-binding domain-containing protein [Bacteroidota bacterium]
MKKKVLLKDVAEYVGVSTALVSYVLNNKEKQARVGDEIAKKIRKAAADLNYQPNLIAKSLQSGKTNTIGLIVADISNPFFSSIARIIEDEAMRQGYVVIFGSSDENPERSMRLIDVFNNRGVDAFIIAPSENAERQIRSLQKQQVPVVLIDRYFKNIRSDYVIINNHDSAYNAVEHLIRNGCRRIAMMAYETHLEHMQQRIGGYRQALKDNGIEFRENWLPRVSYKDVAHQVEDYIKALTRPRLKVDGFFFATNTLAVESLKPLTRMGIRIPEDLAIVSFDESDAFDLFYPPVTYVSQSLDAIGKGAVDLALARILDKKKKPEQLVIASKLVIRESSIRKRSK